jgi:hypothetical protein
MMWNLAVMELLVGLVCLAHLGTGIAVVVVYDSAPTCSTVWPYCIAALVASGLTLFTIHALARAQSRRPGYTPTVWEQPRNCGCLAVALLIWGSIILTISEECKQEYKQTAPYLWIYFIVSFVLSVLTVAACCGFCSITYHNIHNNQQTQPDQKPFPAMPNTFPNSFPQSFPNTTMHAIAFEPPTITTDVA